MQTPSLVVRSRRVIGPHSSGPASVHISGGIITAIEPYESIPDGVPTIDAGESVLMPGLIDTHVHLNDPGRTHWEGFYTGTRAAAAGGITALVDMPLNSIPATTTLAGLRAKLAAAAGNCWVDTGLWGGVVPGNADQIGPLFDAGVRGFKCFLVPSGVEEFGHVTEADLRAALPRLAECGAVLLAHAELPGPIEAARVSGSGRAYPTWLASRPRAAENQAIEMLIRLCREFHARIHIVHLSSSEAVPLLQRAKEDGLPVTVETCPHYLCFTAEEIPDGATEFKCAPPIRESENRERLWDALAEGVIDLIASDHSPCPPGMKCCESGDFLRAWGGIASVQVSLAAVWSQARGRGYGPERIAAWMSSGPARLAGLEHRKGSIEVGHDADLVIWDPNSALPSPLTLHHRHKLTPYEGRTRLHGVVQQTILRGETIFDRGVFPATPAGRMLLRGSH